MPGALQDSPRAGLTRDRLSVPARPPASVCYPLGLRAKQPPPSPHPWVPGAAAGARRAPGVRATDTF